MSEVQETYNPETLWDLIKETRYGMLTHRHEDGLLHSHPLTTQNKRLDADALLYFFIPKDGEIAHVVAHDGSVNVAYANPDDDTYVSVTGRASMLDDPALKEKLFTSFAKAWFPGGAGDPNLGLLAVEIVSADYWEVQDSKLTQLFKMMRSAVTGNPPTDIGEHARVVMN
ncbi:pyridoxamine 5'-phosphate oxidase family protein [Variovorax sp. J22R133]|uniref:pyridoxamine 5'-phosphate oxidase family protein n=1 Tax=Variovorax brevis TaxID=3053503 RepID=UPI0025775D66|nr:pyridoxamine 5'-phosphate oxidase family protein [Variovorax sp. J22R133]MDM0114355.1 pyridoxamine 5'-phosphate oxidase family protein [Variovorax sp. J22R133]